MPDMTDLLKTMQAVARNTNEAGQPAEYVFGTVIGDDPLQIQVSQKLILEDIQLALTRNVTEFTTMLNGNEAVINNSLEVGEKVVMMKQKGGQQYLVLDRVVT